MWTNVAIGLTVGAWGIDAVLDWRQRRQLGRLQKQEGKEGGKKEETIAYNLAKINASLVFSAISMMVTVSALYSRAGGRVWEWAEEVAGGWGWGGDGVVVVFLATVFCISWILVSVVVLCCVVLCVVCCVLYR